MSMKSKLKLLTAAFTCSLLIACNGSGGSSGGGSTNNANVPNKDGNGNGGDVNPVISIMAKSTTPINESAGNAVFTLTSTPAPKQNLTIIVNVSESGNVTGTKPETVEIPMDQSKVDFNVPLDDDNVNEPGSTVTVEVESGNDYSPAQPPGNKASLMVADNDGPRISIKAKSIVGINEGADNAVFTLISTPAPSENLTVNINVTETGNVTGIKPVTVKIPMGQSETDFNVPLDDDNVMESDSAITVEIRSGEDYSPAQPPGNMTSLTVEDNDGPRISIMAKSTVPIDESAGNAVFTVISTPAPSENLTVNVNVTETGSVIGTKPQTVVIPMGRSQFDLNVPLDDDNVNELDSTITVTAQSGSGYAVSKSPGSEGQLTVTDNDQITITAISVAQVTNSGKTQCENTRVIIEGCPLKVEVTLGDNTGIQWSRPLTVNFGIGNSITATSTSNKIRKTNVLLDPNNPGNTHTIATLDILCNEGDEVRGNNNFTLVAALSDGNGYKWAGSVPLTRITIKNIRDGDVIGCPENTTTPFTDNGGLEFFPLVSVDIPTGPIPDNRGPIIINVTSTPAPNFDMQVNFDIQHTPKNLVSGEVMKSTTVPKGQTTAQLIIPLNESSSGGGLQIQLINGAYDHANEFATIISITDATSQSPPRSQTQARASRALNEEILPDLLASTSGHSMETVSERIDFAFENPGRASFELNGSSSPSDLISSAGEMVNNGDLSWEKIRNGSSFTVPLTLDESGIPMTFWGRGFGMAVSNDANSRFDWNGETAVGHLGLDAAFGKRLLVGLSASFDESSVNFELDRHKGTYDVRMTNFSPYLAWFNQDMSTRLKFSPGYGVGEIEIDYEDQSPETADSHQHSILIGIRDQLASLHNSSGYSAGLALDTEFRLARQFVQDNGEGILGTGIGNRSLNTSLEGTLEKTFASGSVFSPFATANTKWKGGSHEPGAELDLTSGMEFKSLSGFRISGSNFIQLIGESERRHELEGSLEFDSGNDRRGILLDSSFAYQPIDGYLSRSMGFGYGFNPDSRVRLGVSKGDISSAIKLNSLVQW